MWCHFTVTVLRLFTMWCHFTVSLHSVKTIHKMMSFHWVTWSRLFTRQCHFTGSLHQDYSQDDVISLCHSINTIHKMMSFHCVTPSRLFTMWCHFTVSLHQDYSEEDVIFVTWSRLFTGRRHITEFLWWDCNLESSLQTKKNKFPARPINFTMPSVEQIHTGKSPSGTPENPTTTSTLRCDIMNLFSARKRNTHTKKEKSWEKSVPKWNDKCVVMLNCTLVPNLLLFGVSVVWLWVWVRRGKTRTLEGFWRLCGTRFRAESV